MKQIQLLFFMLLAAVGFSQYTVSGTVADANGNGLMSATVRENGTSNGTLTDIDGSYSLEVSSADAPVTISYIGYTTQTITASSVPSVVTMTEDNVLQDVVVVAYGTQKKEELTGSVSEVREEVIENYTSSSILKSLDGAISGVQVSPGSGQPGSGVSVNIRGIGSIDASSSPLYVVDGVPYSGYINAINPNDIASISVLKDAAANALYGHRGANGVVMITTKKGSQKGLQVSLNTRMGFSSRGIKDYDVVTDPKDFYEYRWEALRNGFVDSGMSMDEANATASAQLVENLGGYNNYDVPNDQLVLTDGTFNPSANLIYNDDWNSAMFDTAFRPESNLAISGGDEKAKYYFSLGYIDDKAYYIESGFDRLSSRLNADFTPADWIKVGASLSYSNTTQNNPDQTGTAYSNPFQWVRNIGPIYPVYFYDANGNPVMNADGSRKYDIGTLAEGMGARPYGDFQNPVATSYLDIKENRNDNLFGQLYSTISFLNDFDFTYRYSNDFYDRNVTDFDTPLLGDAGNAGGYYGIYSSRNHAQTHQQLLNYVKDLGDHSFELLAGHESYDENYRYLDGDKTKGLIVDLPSLNNAVQVSSLSSGETDYRVEGWLSRLNYNFDDRYYLSGSLRRDASSVFAPNKRWGTFWGVGGSWRVSKEDFFDVPFVNEFKLKAGYGTQGNDQILFPGGSRVYQTYTDLYRVSNNAGAIALNQEWRANPDLTWETSKTFNIGADLIVWDDRVNISGEYFIKETEDLLYHRPLPFSLGNPSFVASNIGDMENKGFEIELGADLIKNQNIVWDVRASGSHYKNTVTRIADEAKDDNGGYFNGRFRVEEGRSLYAINMYQYAGVDPETGNPQWWNYDENGERTKTSEYEELTSTEDRQYTGDDAIPDFFGGFGTGLNWQNKLSLTADFTYQLGGMGLDGIYQGLMHNGTGNRGQNIHKDALNAWSEGNTSSSTPRLSTANQNVNSTSDYWLIDMSYFNVRNITARYTLPTDITERIKLSNASVFVTGDNLALFTKRQGYDPRTSLTGSSSNISTPMRTVAVGLNVNF